MKIRTTFVYCSRCSRKTALVLPPKTRRLPGLPAGWLHYQTTHRTPVGRIGRVREGNLCPACTDGLKDFLQAFRTKSGDASEQPGRPDSEDAAGAGPNPGVSTSAVTDAPQGR